jgi:hypothetical protein
VPKAGASVSNSDISIRRAICKTAAATYLRVLEQRLRW